MSRRISALAVLGLALAGCGTSHHASNHPPYTLRVEAAGRAVLGHRRFPFFVSPTRLAIQTRGSSSCPKVPAKLAVRGPHMIELRMATGSWDRRRLVPHPPKSGICTSDYGSTAMVVSLPGGVDVHHPLTVVYLWPGRFGPSMLVAPPL